MCVRQTIMGPATMKTTRLKTTRRLTHVSSILGRTGPFHNGWLRKAKIRKLGPRPRTTSRLLTERGMIERASSRGMRSCHKKCNDWPLPSVGHAGFFRSGFSSQWYQTRNRVSSFAKDQGRPIKSHIVPVPASVSLFIVRLTTLVNSLKLLRSMSSQPSVDLSLNK